MKIYFAIRFAFELKTYIYFNLYEFILYAFSPFENLVGRKCVNKTSQKN